MTAPVLRFAALGLASAVVTGPASARDPQFRARVDVVTLDVSVRRGNRPVADLTADDFDVRDNGVLQTGLAVSRERLPIDATFVLDLSDSVRRDVIDGLARAVDAVRSRLTPPDRVAAIAFNERVRQAVLGTAPSATFAAPLHGAGKTSLLDATAVALAGLTQPDRRSIVLVFTDGLDTSSFLDERAVLDLARMTGHAVFAVALAPPGWSQPLLDRHEQFFETLTATTGGRFARVRSGGDVGPALLAAVDEFRACYVIHYTPRGVEAPGWHTVDVGVRRTGSYDVRARRGYEKRP